MESLVGKIYWIIDSYLLEHNVPDDLISAQELEQLSEEIVQGVVFHITGCGG